MSKSNTVKPELRTSLIYFTLGLTWVTLSNFLYHQFQDGNIWLIILNDGLFVGVTAVVFYLVVKNISKSNSVFTSGNLNLVDIFENSDDLMMVVKEDLTVTGYNKRFAEYVKKFFKMEVYLGGDLIKYVIPDNIDSFRERISKVLKGEVVTLERRLALPNDVTIWFEITYRPILEKDGPITSFIATARDITERKKTEIELVLSKLKFEAIYNNTEAALFIVEPNTEVILDCNEKALKIFEADNKDQIIGKRGIDFHANSLSEDESTELTKIYSGNSGLKIDFQYRTLKENLFTGEFNSYVIDVGKDKFTIVWVNDITHKKVADQKLSQSERTLKAILDTTLETSVLIDKDMKVIFADKQLRESTRNIFNYDIKIGDCITDFVIEPLKENFKRNFEIAWQGEHVRKEKKIPTTNNKYIWLDVVFVPILDEDGKANHVLFSYIDITHLKEIQEKLKASETKFRQLADTSPVMMWTADETGDITFYNKAWLDFRGRTFNQEIGRGWIDGVHPDDLEWFVNGVYYPSFQNRTSYSSEYRLLNDKGQYRWILETGVPKFDKDFEFEGLVGSALDITDRKKAEIKLKEDERFISRVTELSPYIIYIYDLETNQYVYMNQKDIGNVGLSKEEILGKSQEVIATFIPKEDLNKFLYTNEYIEKLNSKGVVETEFRLFGKKNGLRWIQTRDTIFATDPSSKPTQILGSARDVTNKKKVEQKLLEEQKLNERISQLSPDIIYIQDVNTGINIYENRSILELLGYGPNELEGTIDSILFSILHPEDMERIKKYYSNFNSWNDNEIKTSEYRLKGKDGSYRWFMTEDLVFARNEKGIVTEILGNTRDITDRKQFEEKLIDEKRFSSQITENSPHIIYIFDVEKQELIYVNNKIFIMLGYSTDDMKLDQGDNLFSKIVHPEDITTIYMNLQNFGTLQDNEEMNTEVRVLHKDGSIRWVSMKHIVFKRNKAGVPIQMLGNASDITERKLMEVKLLEEQKFSHQITEASPSLIWILDVKDKKIIYANQSFIETLGYSPEEILELKEDFMPKILHPEDSIYQEEVMENFQKLNDSQTLEYEFRTFHRNGKIVWLHFRSIVFKRDENEKPVFILGTGQDVTQRKMVEDNLIRTNKELKIANEELDGFVYRASHDLRSPLSSVLGLINILKYDIKEDHQMNYINLMQKSIEKLMNVIEDLINHSKNSRLEIMSVEINLEQLISEMIQDLKYIDNAEKINFDIKVEGDAKFYSDLLRLNLLFNNLISNAIKYHLHAMDYPFIKIRVHTDKDKCLIEVTDNGSGIEEKYQDKIFNMFYRASKNSTGSGLGLYIVKGIIEKLEGTILMKSVYGKGTSFYIELPNMIYQNN